MAEVTFDCKVTKEVFNDKDTGQAIPYYSCMLIVGDEEIKVNISQYSKKLFNFLVKEYFE